MSYASVLSSLNPTLAYPMDDVSGPTVVDSIGSNDGTAGGGITFGAAALIQEGTALTFPGTTGDYITSGSGVTTDAGFTVAVWFKTTATGTDVMVSQVDGAGTGESLIYLTDGQVKCAFGGAVNVESPLTAYNDGETHSAVVTFAGGTGGAINLRVDGVLVDSSTTTGGGATGALIVGATKTGGGRWAGTLDEFSFWQGTAISAANALTLYNAGIGSRQRTRQRGRRRHY